MSTDEKKPPVGGAVDADSAGVMRLLSKPLGNVTRVEVSAALVEWERGDHTHLSFEIMRSDGAWEPLACVALADCLTVDGRRQLRQFPVFRLAWWGQVGEPLTMPKQEPSSIFQSLVTAAADFKYWLDIQPVGKAHHPGGGDVRDAPAYKSACQTLSMAQAVLKDIQST